MNKTISPLLSALAAALILAACAAPEFRQPQIEVPVAFKESASPQTVAQTAADGTRWQQAHPAEAAPRGEWWLAFHDPALNQLIAQASEANANLAVAAARVKQARAIAGIAQADRSPQVGLSAGPTRERVSPLSVDLPQGTPVPPTNLYQANLTASYEVDLFGRVSSNVAAARSWPPI